MVVKHVEIGSYIDLYDATVALEERLEALVDNGFQDIKGEIVLISGKWRCGVITNDRQFELDV